MNIIIDPVVRRLEDQRDEMPADEYTELLQAALDIDEADDHFPPTGQTGAR